MGVPQSMDRHLQILDKAEKVVYLAKKNHTRKIFGVKLIILSAH
jgi:hypothetical protein